MSYIEVFGTLFDAELDGTNLSTYGFYCYDIKKPLMGRQKQITFDPPGRPGLIQISKKFTEYELILKGYVEADSHDDLVDTLDTLAAALYSDTDVELIISKKNDRYWNVQYLDYEIIDERDNYSLVDLKFYCADPFAYDTTADTDTQEDVTTNDTTYNVTNSGHYYCYPTATITFNQAQDHIYLQNNTIEDCRFDISQSFAAADELIINFKTGVVTLNGTETYAGIGVGGSELAEMIRLAFGVNQIQVGSDDADIDIDVDMSFRKVYLS